MSARGRIGSFGSFGRRLALNRAREPKLVSRRSHDGRSTGEDYSGLAVFQRIMSGRLLWLLLFATLQIDCCSKVD